MLIKHYRNRLPADYDMRVVRRRVAERGPLWDRTPGLGFKAFALTDRDNGAAANSYAAFYVWLGAEAAVGFLLDDRFDAVVASFGRPSIATWLPFDIRIGAGDDARFLMREDRLVDEAAGLAALHREETAISRALAERPETVACVLGLDPANWRLSRFTLLTDPPAGRPHAEIAHFAHPGLSDLRRRQS